MSNNSLLCYKIILLFQRNEETGVREEHLIRITGLCVLPTEEVSSSIIQRALHSGPKLVS